MERAFFPSEPDPAGFRTGPLTIAPVALKLLCNVYTNFYRGKITNFSIYWMVLEYYTLHILGESKTENF